MIVMSEAALCTHNLNDRQPDVMKSALRVENKFGHAAEVPVAIAR